MPFYLDDLKKQNILGLSSRNSNVADIEIGKFIFDDPEEFVRTMAPLYIQSLNKYGIDVNYMPQLLAQACLESDWGKRPIGWETNTPTFNFIGEKSLDGKGYNSATTEYNKSGKYKTKTIFRTWNSLKDAVNFHVWKFSRGRWVAHNIYDPNNIDGFPYRVEAAKYATAPDYGNEMIPFVNKVKTILSK